MTKWNDDPHWHEEFKQHHQLIYTPLDLPNPPTIDYEKFMYWCAKSNKLDLQREQHAMPAKSGGTYIPASATGKKLLDYPWHPAHALDPSSELWLQNFDKEFPDLVEYINLFPLRKLKSINFIRQRPGVEAFLHTDPDDWLGFRFYIKNNCQRDCLYFKKLKPEYANGKRYSTYEYSRDQTSYRDWNSICEDKKIYANQKDQAEHAWALTSSWAAHGIDALKDDEERITCIILGVQNFQEPGGGYKINDTLDLLARSENRFADRQIRYDR